MTWLRDYDPPDRESPPGGGSGGGGVAKVPDPIVPVYGDAVPVVIGTGRVKAQLVFRGLPGGAPLSGLVCIGEVWQSVMARFDEVAVYAICEAPVADVLRHWNGAVPSGGVAWNIWNGIVTLTGSVEVVKTATAAAWAALVGTDAEGMGFSGTVHARVSKMLLRPDDGSPPELEFEVKSTLASAASPDGLDCLAADALVFLWTDAKSGLGRPLATIDVEHGADGAVASSYRRHCEQQGLWVSRVLLSRDRKNDVIESLLDATDATLVEVDGVHRVVPLADRPVGTFAPDLRTQVIGDDDFFYESGDHLRVERLNPQDRNVFPVEYQSRGVDYHTSTVEGWDAAAVSQSERRRAGVLRIPWVITNGHAAWLAETLALRALTTRNVYTLRLKPKWAAIMVSTDFLSVSESRSGIVDRVMRVTSVGKPRGGSVTVEAVDWLSVESSGASRQVASGILTPTVIKEIGATYGATQAAQTAADTAQSTANNAASAASAAQTTANNAASAASAAQTDASSALSQLTDIASDNILSAVEKSVVVRDHAVITSEQAGIDAQATAFGITTEKTNYDTAVSDLISYLATLTTPYAWNSFAGGTTVVGGTFRSKFQDVYATRQTLLDAIYAKAKQLADNAQSAAGAAQTTANNAASAAAQAQTTADGKARVSYGAAPHSPAGINDQWFNGDTTTNCPDNNCKGHTLSGQTPQVGAYPHRKLNWPHRYTGSVWLDSVGVQSLVAGDVTAGAVDTVALAAKSVKTTDYTYTGTIDTATEVATKGCRMRNSDAPGTLPAFLASGKGIKVGSFVLDEPILTTLTGLARTGLAVNDVVWYRGNINRNKRNGAPLLVDVPWTRSTNYIVGDMVTGDPVTAGTYPMNTNRDGSAGAAQRYYYCITAGTSAATGTGPTGTAADITDGTCHWAYQGSIALNERLSIVTHQTFSTSTGGFIYRFDFTLQPRHLMDDNFDALRYLAISAFSPAKAPNSGWPEFYVPIADRSYKWSGTPGNAVNASRVSAIYASVAAWYYNGGGFPFNGYLRVALYNVYGSSDARDFDFTAATTDPATANAGGWTLGGSSPPAGGGGDNGGGGCPAPEIGVLLADGAYRPAGLVRPGDRIWTIGEDDGPGQHEVIAAEIVRDSDRLVLALDDGARIVYSPRHPVMTPSGWSAVKNLRRGDHVLTIKGDRRVASVLPVAAGPVVRISTTGRTYVTAGGLLNHNMKDIQG